MKYNKQQTNGTDGDGGDDGGATIVGILYKWDCGELWWTVVDCGELWRTVVAAVVVVINSMLIRLTELKKW